MMARMLAVDLRRGPAPVLGLAVLGLGGALAPLAAIMHRVHPHRNRATRRLARRDSHAVRRSVCALTAVL